MGKTNYCISLEFIGSLLFLGGRVLISLVLYKSLRCFSALLFDVSYLIYYYSCAGMDSVSSSSKHILLYSVE